MISDNILIANILIIIYSMQGERIEAHMGMGIGIYSIVGVQAVNSCSYRYRGCSSVTGNRRSIIVYSCMTEIIFLFLVLCFILAPYSSSLKTISAPTN
jgi:hypothetical protein